MSAKYVIKAGASIITIREQVRWSSYANLYIPNRFYVLWYIKHRTV
jgi:hypothetical protein